MLRFDMENFQLNSNEVYKLQNEELVSFMELVSEDESLREELVNFCRGLRDFHDYSVLQMIPEYHFLIQSGMPEGAPVLDVNNPERQLVLDAIQRFISRVTNSGS